MTAETARPLLVEVAEGIATLTLNRPDRLNALDLEMAGQFIAALEELGRDEAVRVLVLRGAGRVFSAGGDAREMLGNVSPGQDRAAYFRAPLAAFNRMVLSLCSLPRPVLAVAHGAVAGVAFNLLLACDLRLVAEGTRFTQAFVKLGLSPDGGGTYFLPRLVGHARACELTLLPTEISAQTALAWGLVNWVVPPGELDRRASEICRQISQGPALALGRTKRLLVQSHDLPLAAQMEAERLAQIENAASTDFEEGLRAFSEKRPPRFQGR